MSDTNHIPAGPCPVGRIYSIQPQYGGGRPESHRAFDMDESTGTKYQRWANKKRLAVYNGGSLLANNFNQGLCHALNLRLAGEDVTHWVLLHDDVVPAHGWMDQLLDDLLEAQAKDPRVAVMSAVIPIKDPLGLTSTAIAGPDDWEVLRRLTMTEVYDLPEVFGATDCGYPDGTLLVNTGCMVADLTQDWCRRKVCGRLVGGKDAYTGNNAYYVGDCRKYRDEECSCPLACFFTIKDRVSLKTDPKTGEKRFVADAAPEDWNFSRMVQALGYRVMATRRVAVDHWGGVPYSNRQPWGELRTDTLLEHRHKGKVVGVPGSYQAPPDDVPGWLTTEEGRLLARLADGKQVLEIGSYCGRSTIWLARTAAAVHCVDPFDASGITWRGEAHPDYPRGDTYALFEANLKRFGVRENVTIYRCRSTAFPYTMHRGPGFDLVFLDGAHDEASVQADIDLARQTLKPGGLIAFHDYGGRHEPGVRQAVNAAFGAASSSYQTTFQAADVVERVGTTLVLRPHASFLRNGATADGQRKATAEAPA